MALVHLKSSRRIRLVGIALVLTCLVLYLGYQTPLAVARTEPLDSPQLELTKAETPIHDAQDAQEAIPPPPATTTTIISRPAAATPIDDPPTLEELYEQPPDLDPQATPTTLSEEPRPSPTLSCPKFEYWQSQNPGPLSEGKRKFPYVRPPPECRTFALPAMEDLIAHMKTVITDPDLFRLFENSYPNTLDTMVKWRGFANKTDPLTEEQVVTDEELTYVITGDIDAMWLRDSASQIYSYLPLLEPSTDPDSLASLWRGLINSHARYIVISPYCHSFQPPPESGIPPTGNNAFSNNHPNPPYNPELVFDCKWELDSLASFLQISSAYYSRTGDLEFFGKHSWVAAVQAAVDAAAAMRLGTYDKDGHVLPSAWTFVGWTNRGSETLTNDGLGNPVKENGMVRSGFRPSDDACIFQLLTPSNMMFAAYLEHASVIMEGLVDINGTSNLTMHMRKLASTIRRGIARDGVVTHRDFGEIFAYEVDGYGSANLMDDANVPSLLAMPLWNYTQPKTAPKMVKSVRGGGSHRFQGNKTLIKSTTDAEAEQEQEQEPEQEHDYARIYQNTRAFVLSMANPYYAKGPALSAVGGPHLGPGKGWPMAATVAGLTAFETLAGLKDAAKREAVVAEQLFMVLNSTAGTGVVHETVNAWSGTDWTRSWFGWANGLFGELVLKIAEDEAKRGVKKGEGLLGRSWQD
ncbi:hypothetical protein B0T22DRAFT_477743 [Podospora appendiculata]|uniref:Uncharacterized protein n=1 Tax=Podospora appendiculata TaxID=314037 RepID=A0AAE0XKN7_9PEZI|nr:hypothetical protein B0T22DRAFT_477743 [Podospora appendiculata]